MIQYIPAANRKQAKLAWLNTFYLFSFANYYDPENIQFGTLRVFNDDRIDAYYGFDEHAHQNMEIVTIMLEGELTHRDSMGNVAKIKAGEVQRMSAGKGVIHAEKNLAGDPVHLYQLWFFPRREGIAPSYAQADFSYRLNPSGLTPVVSGETKGEALSMYADAAVYMGNFKAGDKLTFPLAPQKGLFVYLTSGELEINGQKMTAGDQVRITNESEIELGAKSDVSCIVIEVGGI